MKSKVSIGFLDFELGKRSILTSSPLRVGKRQERGKTMSAKLMISKLALIGLAGICAVLPSAAAQSSVQADANGVNITGHVSCARFGTGSVTARKGMSVAQTIQYCVNFMHSDYTLVSGNRIYRLSGDNNLLAKMSGQTVTVAGHMVPESTDTATYALMGTVAVSTVVPTKD